MSRAIALTADRPCLVAATVGTIASCGELGAAIGQDVARAFSARMRRAFGHASAAAGSAILPIPRRAHAMAPSSASKSDARTDEELVVAHRAGDGSALRVLIERYQGELHGFLTRFVGSRAGADDVFQEAFLQVHLSADAFDAERRFKPWLYTIAANKGRDFLRRQKRRAAVSLDAPVGDGSSPLVDLLGAADAGAAAGSLEASDEAGIVKGVVDDLPTHFREILLLAYFQKMSYAQIADSLAIPLGTVKSRLHAAVACFAETWRIACARRGIKVDPSLKPQRPGAGREESDRPQAQRSRGTTT